ncbi:hypothetical protein RA210_U390015 [Rubrivivax sp. A210]|nr:hypothetical protein RA210_U390015 [Rubrivivax sp. A210]
MCHRPGPGGLPLALRLSEGLGFTYVPTLNGSFWIVSAQRSHLELSPGTDNDRVHAGLTWTR